MATVGVSWLAIPDGPMNLAIWDLIISHIFASSCFASQISSPSYAILIFLSQCICCTLNRPIFALDEITTILKKNVILSKFDHCLSRKLSFCQFPLPPVMKTSSKWRHFPFSAYGPCLHHRIRHQSMVPLCKARLWNPTFPTTSWNNYLTMLWRMLWPHNTAWCRYNTTQYNIISNTTLQWIW